MSSVGDKVKRMREHFGGDDDDRGGRRGRRRGGRDRDEDDGVPPLVRAALDNLREVAAAQIEADSDAETRIVEVLARAAQELKKA
jgi:hypothetical protein